MRRWYYPPMATICKNCQQAVPEGSAFCNHCGQRMEVEAGPPENDLAQAATASFAKSLKERSDRISAVQKDVTSYLAREPSEVNEPLHYLWTAMGVVGAKQTHCVGSNRDPDREDVFTNLHSMIQGWPSTLDEVPPVLESGLVLTTNLCEPVKYQHLMAIAMLRQLQSEYLDRVLEEAKKKAQAAMVGDQTKAQLSNMTFHSAFSEAEVYWRQFENNEIDEAQAGFERLCDLAPQEGYFRYMLGSVYQRRGRQFDALRELVHAHWLNPQHVETSVALVLVLVSVGMGPIALDVGHGALQQLETMDNPIQSAQAELYMRAARIQSSLTGSWMLGLDSSEVLPGPTRLDLEPLLQLIPGKNRLRDDEWFVGTKQTDEEGDYPLAGEKVFISYRRTDTLDAARKLKDDLTSLERLDVFFDETGLGGGTQWEDTLRDQIDLSKWVLVLIGPTWLTDRLQNPNDVVRREVARALSQARAVIPVLVDGASVPPMNALPSDIQELVDTQFVHWSSENTPWLVLEALKRTFVKTPTLEELMEMNLDPQEINLPRFVEKEANEGQGFRKPPLPDLGRWQITITEADGRKTSYDVELSDDPGMPFRGTFTVEPAFFWEQTKTFEVEGSHAQILAKGSRRFLGLYLHGVIDGREFTQEVPMDRKLGGMLVGQDEDGRSYASNNVQPKRL